MIGSREGPDINKSEGEKGERNLGQYRKKCQCHLEQGVCVGSTRSTQPAKTEGVTLLTCAVCPPSQCLITRGQISRTGSQRNAVTSDRVLRSDLACVGPRTNAHDVSVSRNQRMVTAKATTVP